MLKIVCLVPFKFSDNQFAATPLNSNIEALPRSKASKNDWLRYNICKL